VKGPYEPLFFVAFSLSRKLTPLVIHAGAGFPLQLKGLRSNQAARTACAQRSCALNE
jgi:hypothetical protein